MTIEELIRARRRWVEGPAEPLLDFLQREGHTTERGQLGNYNDVPPSFLEDQLRMEVLLRLAETLDRLERPWGRSLKLWILRAFRTWSPR